MARYKPKHATIMYALKVTCKGKQNANDVANCMYANMERMATTTTWQSMRYKQPKFTFMCRDDFVRDRSVADSSGSRVQIGLLHQSKRIQIIIAFFLPAERFNQAHILMHRPPFAHVVWSTPQNSSLSIFIGVRVGQWSVSDVGCLRPPIGCSQQFAMWQKSHKPRNYR